ncbi:uromodulin-like [Leptodactylus fuscus]|uniref:uromodulin-like n=1 Tax=Leptodactylus fuscus TaxID=238119 RepID=UPI003F4ED516
MRSLLVLALCALLEYAGAACYSGSDPVPCYSCAGSCTFDNGCHCSNDFTGCVPSSNSECPMGDNTCCGNLVGRYWDSSLHCCTETPFCYPGCSGDEVCGVVNNAAVCVCDRNTYQGIKISDLRASVDCDGGLMTISISRCQLQQLGYDASTLHFNGDSAECKASYGESRNNIRVQSIQLRAVSGLCGNVVTKTDSKIYYSNTLFITQKPGPIITRNPIVFSFTCEYSLDMQIGIMLSPQS